MNNHITKHLRIDGQPVILAYTARSRRNQNGEVIGTYGTAIEVTGMVAQLSGQAQRDAHSEEAASSNLNSAKSHPWERRQLKRQLEILKQQTVVCTPAPTSMSSPDACEDWSCIISAIRRSGICRKIWRRRICYRHSLAVAR